MAAGGALMGPTAITRNEDDVLAAPNALSAMRIGPGDAVIGLAASGTTPFVRAGLPAAVRAGAWTCGIAHNPGAPLLRDGGLGDPAGYRPGGADRLDPAKGGNRAEARA